MKFCSPITNAILQIYRKHCLDLLGRAIYKLGPIHVSPVITGSGGLTLATHLHVPFVQEVIAVSTALQDYAPSD